MSEPRRSYFEDVGAFHQKFNLPAAGWALAAFPAESVIRYRVEFIEEEMLELKEGIAQRNLVQVADALADIVYVALGTAHYFGIPFDDVWRAVQRSNMAKVRSDGSDDHKRGTVEVIRKPEGWQPPNILRILNVHNAQRGEGLVCSICDGMHATSEHGL